MMLTSYDQRYVCFDPEVKLFVGMLILKVLKVVLSTLELFSRYVFLEFIAHCARQLRYWLQKRAKAGILTLLNDRLWLQIWRILLLNSARTIMRRSYRLSCLLTTRCWSETSGIWSALIILPNELWSVWRKNNWTPSFIKYLIRYYIFSNLRLVNILHFNFLVLLQRQRPFFFYQKRNRMSTSRLIVFST